MRILHSPALRPEQPNPAAPEPSWAGRGSHERRALELNIHHHRTTRNESLFQGVYQQMGCACAGLGRSHPTTRAFYGLNNITGMKARDETPQEQARSSPAQPCVPTAEQNTQRGATKTAPLTHSSSRLKPRNAPGAAQSCPAASRAGSGHPLPSW